MALSVNQAQQAGFQQDTSNAMQSFFAEQKPQISNIVFYNHKGILPMNVYKTMGLMKEVAGETAQHYEAGWVHPNWHVQGNATAGGPGQQLTVVVSAAEVAASNNTAYTRVTDTIWQADGNFSSVVAKTLVGNEWQVTLNPYDPTVTLSVTAGDAMWIVGNTQLEGTDQPAPRDTGKQLLQFPLQTIKETVKFTGTALSNELWFSSDQFGQPRDTYNSGYIDADYRFVEQMGNITTFQTPNINPNNTDVNMYGIDYVVNSTGNTVDYFNGSYGINEFKENIRYANKQGTGAKFWMMTAPELNLSFQTGASDVLAQNPNQFVKEDGNNADYTEKFTAGYEQMAVGAGLEVNINFKKLSYGGKVFYVCEVQQWGYDSTGGADGWGVTGNGYFIPLQRSEDAEGTVRDRFTCTYKKFQRWNRSLHVWEYGAWASNPNSTNDSLQLNFLGEWGTEFMGPQHFQKAAQA